MTKDTTRAEDFKRATTGARTRHCPMPPTSRVAFQPGPRRPDRPPRPPARAPPAPCPTPKCRSCAGPADSVALRLRHHDDAVHARSLPAERGRAGGL